MQPRYDPDDVCFDGIVSVEVERVSNNKCFEKCSTKYLRCAPVDISGNDPAQESGAGTFRHGRVVLQTRTYADIDRGVVAQGLDADGG